MTDAEKRTLLNHAACNISKLQISAMPADYYKLMADLFAARVAAEMRSLEQQGVFLMACGFAVDELTIAKWQPSGEQLVIPSAWLPCTIDEADEKLTALLPVILEKDL